MSEQISERTVLRRVGSSLLEVVVVEMQPGYRAQRSTCPDGQFWISVRGEQVVHGDGYRKRQGPFELAYYAPREPAIRTTDGATLAYGIRLRLSTLRDDEYDSSWLQPSLTDWHTHRQALRLLAMCLHAGPDSHKVDEEVVKWLSQSPSKSETSRAKWLRQAEELVVDDPTLSLVELSRRVGVNAAYLSASFTQVHGVTLSSFRRQVMVSKALRNVSVGTLNEAAIEAGFYDASHFHRACIAELDMKPSSLRRLISPT
jgi:AraC-like DNA-binding protein